WANLCTVLNIENKDEWQTNAGRIAEREVIESMLAEIVTGYSREELEELLTGIPCAPVNTITEALNDKQSKARGLVTEYNGVDVLASPLRFY
ncbi:MAG: CoA transferase, partial [Candidatus Poseidoniaceae archaeon]